MVLQIEAFERLPRKGRETGNISPTYTVLGLLPQSHIYGLVVIGYASIYRGDGVILLPKFDLQSYLQSIQKYVSYPQQWIEGELTLLYRYKINTLFLVQRIVLTEGSTLTLL